MENTKINYKELCKKLIYNYITHCEDMDEDQENIKYWLKEEFGITENMYKELEIWL